MKIAVEFTQGEVDSLKEQVKQESKNNATDVESLHKMVAELELKLKEEVEHNINLEQYTRRENLRFNNIPETEDENCKDLIYDVIEKDLGVDTSQFRFHQFTGLERWPKIDADQSLLGSFVGRTETAFGLKEARLKNPLPTLTHISRKTTPKLYKMKEES